jgi:aminoglycoside phosphotransferase (APT) family kinase protein
MPYEGRSGLIGLDIAALNIPSMAEVVERYCALTGRSGVPALDWYFAYNIFRISAISQGIAGRIRDGTAASAQAIEIAGRAEPLAQAAWQFAQKAGA